MQPILCRPLVLALLAAALWCAQPAGAAAQQPLIGQPVYDPASRSYFELARVTDEQRTYSARSEPEVRWEIAEMFARQRVFKGVHGRLATIHSADTYSFLLETFRSNAEAWIGLQYICADQKLQWTDGQLQTPVSFRVWNRRWDQSETNSGCVNGRGGEKPYMPIAVSASFAGFRWFAKGGKKEYTLYFVEYPTGAP